jgi:peptide/nickel transport system substrate-binding protein
MNPVRDKDFKNPGSPSADVSNGTWRERLTRVRTISIFERLKERVRAFSPGDRVLLYALVILVGVASLSGLYTLERSLLVEVPAYGGTLVEGVFGSPQFINPLLATSDADRDLSAMVYAGLMGLSGKGELVPVLAESYTLDDDGRVYTFTLRKDATFSDGTPVAADDVVFTIEKAQNAALKSPKYADWTGVNATAVDQRTVRFTLAKPYAPFLWLTTLGILPSRIWRNISNEEFPFSTLETSPVGAGPFKVANVSRDASGLIRSVSLDANPRYALGRPYLDNIRFDFYSRSEDLASARASGTVESAYGVATDGALTASYARVFGVFWNPSEKQVYARAEVRKAFSLALNRTAIIDDVLGGYATAIMGPVPPGENVKQVSVPQSENPTATAAAVLQSSGWAYDGATRVWNLKTPKQTIERITLRTSNAPELKNIASAVKTGWEKLGIPVDIELYEPGDRKTSSVRVSTRHFSTAWLSAETRTSTPFGIRRSATTRASTSRSMRTRPLMRSSRTRAALQIGRHARRHSRKSRISSPQIIRLHSSMLQTSSTQYRTTSAV